MPENFEVNPNRDATDSIKGYVYQVYQSVLAWINLKESEVLILEGAEDFDVHETNQVVATQVKDTSSNLTLRSSSVIETLNNFWEHFNKNPTYDVSLRFLATASAGQENGSPLGRGIKGLDYWRNVQLENSSVEPLHKFLKSLKLSEELSEYLEQASPEDVQRQIIKRIYWDLDSKPRETIELEIEDRLINHGMALNIDPVESTKVLSHLIKKTADILTVKGIKKLRRSDFVRYFHEKTSVTMPKGQFDALQNALIKLGNLEHADIPQLSKSSIFSAPFPVVAGSVFRAKLVEKITLTLKDKGVIFLHGSTGLGKSNLAALITKNLKESWKWASFRDLSGDQMKHVFFQMTTTLPNSQASFIVLDDVDFSNFKLFEREIVLFVLSIMNSNGLIIFTGQTNPPFSFLSKISVDNTCEFSVPYFEEADISEMLGNFGLADSKYISSWSKVIWMNTFGHPQLIHARILGLKSKNWPEITKKDILKPDEIEKIKEGIAKSLVNELPTETVRTLAYRLSIISGSFTRDVALALASLPPEINLPGEVFDHLVGPWVERESEERFRLSPLLSGAANKVFPEKGIKDIHAEIGLSIIKRKSLNLQEISSAFFHGYLGKNEHVLTILSNLIVTEISEHVSLLYDSLRWFTLVSLAKNEVIYDGNPYVDLILRLSQFKLIASSPNKEYAVEVVKRLEETLNRLEKTSEKSQHEMSESLVYGIVLIAIDVPIPSSIALRLLSRFMDIGANNEMLNSLLIAYSEKNKHIKDIGNNSSLQVMFSLHTSRVKSTTDLIDLIEALDCLEQNKRDLFLATQSELDFESIMVNQVWWTEAQKDDFDAKKTLAAYQFALDKFKNWNALKYVKTCYVAMAVITDEYLFLKDDAITLLDEAEKEFPNDANIINQRAKILFGTDKSEEAIKLAKLALTLNGLPDIEYLFTCRNAAIECAKANDWLRAANLFLTGFDKGENSEFQKGMAVGLLADAAFAHWKSKNFKEALALYVKTLKLLSSIPYADDLKAHHLHATVRHSITWITMELQKEGSSDLVEPYPGMCSNQEPDKKIVEHKIVGLASIWVLLDITSKVLDVDIGVSKVELKELTANPLRATETFRRNVVLELAYKDGNFDLLIEKLIVVQEVFELHKGRESVSFEQKSEQSIPSLPKDFWTNEVNLYFVKNAIIKASISLTVLCKNLPINKWKKDLNKFNALTANIDNFLAVLEGGKIVHDGVHERAAQAIFLLRGEILVPSDLWMASFRVLDALIGDSLWVESYSEKLFTACWFNAATNQKAYFSSPDIICPQIEQVCLSKSITGKAKLAQLLKISAHYLGRRLSENVIDRLTQITQSK